MNDMQQIKNELFALLREKGACLMGTADLTGFPESTEREMHTGISVAVPVPKNIVEDLKTAPTKEYYDAYYALNRQLDEIVLSGAEFLIQKGYRAFANTTKTVKRIRSGGRPCPIRRLPPERAWDGSGKAAFLLPENMEALSVCPVS